MRVTSLMRDGLPSRGLTPAAQIGFANPWLLHRSSFCRKRPAPLFLPSYRRDIAKPNGNCWPLDTWKQSGQTKNRKSGSHQMHNRKVIDCRSSFQHFKTSAFKHTVYGIWRIELRVLESIGWKSIAKYLGQE